MPPLSTQSAAITDSLLSARFIKIRSVRYFTNNTGEHAWTQVKLYYNFDFGT